MSDLYSQEQIDEDKKTLKSLGVFTAGFFVITVILIVGVNLAFS